MKALLCKTINETTTTKTDYALGLYNFSTIFLYSAKIISEENIIRNFQKSYKGIPFSVILKKEKYFFIFNIPSWLLQSPAACVFSGELVFGSEFKIYAKGWPN